MATIKILIIKPGNKIVKPVFPFKRTQEDSQNNSQILAAFNVNSGAAIETQKGSPLDYGSEFLEITGIKTKYSVTTKTKRR